MGHRRNRTLQSLQSHSRITRHIGHQNNSGFTRHLAGVIRSSHRQELRPTSTTLIRCEGTPWQNRLTHDYQVTGRQWRRVKHVTCSVNSVISWDVVATRMWRTLFSFRVLISNALEAAWKGLCLWIEHDTLIFSLLNLLEHDNSITTECCSSIL